MNFASYIDSEDPMRMWAEDSFGATGIGFAVFQTMQQSSDGVFLCLWDALDEAGGKKKQVLSSIREIMKEDIFYFAIVTTRPSAADAQSKGTLSTMGTRSYVALPLGDEETRIIVSMMLKRSAADEAKTTSIMQILMSPDYMSLRKVPVMLCLLVHVLRKSSVDAAKGLTRASVYNSAMTLSLKAAESKTYGKSESAAGGDIKSNLRYCCQVAWATHTQHKRGFTWDDVAP